MHVIRETGSGRVLHIDHSRSAAPRPGHEVYADFDPETMVVGWTAQRHVPIHFDIDGAGRIVELSLDEAAAAGRHELAPTQKLVDGRIVDKSEQELIEQGQLELAALKRRAVEELSAASFACRQAILPDYKLQNALLGIYDEATVAAFRATVQAFRAAFHRAREAIEAAPDLAGLRAVRAEFPTALAAAAGPAGEEGGS